MTRRARVIVAVTILTLFLGAGPGGAQAPAAGQPAKSAAPDAAQLQARIETYLRDLFAWGTDYAIRVGEPTEAALPGYYQVGIQVTVGGQTEQGVVFISRDGRYLIRGDVFDTTVRPYAGLSARINTEGHPFVGPAEAKVVVVEFSDFQCPHCRELSRTLKEVKPRYPQVRFVHKDFPLTHIHPWAMTAAVAGRCAYAQKPEAFWMVYEAIFERQERILPETAWTAMLEIGEKAGLDVGLFRACMASPEAKKLVEASLEEGRALRIANTPTVFVNGRRIVGGQRNIIEQYIEYELQAAAGKKP